MSVFEEIWREQALCDALLNVAGTQFRAHKLVLCDCSTFFMSLFTQQSSPDCQEFDIAVDVSADIMKIILDYAYTKGVHVTQENLMELFVAADFFGISGITQACAQAMEERLSPSNCITTWELTEKYCNPHLRNQAFLYILKHFEEVMAISNAFLSLSLKNLCSIIAKNQLNVKNESIVFEAVLKWIGHAPQERNKYLANLLSKIRLALVHPKYFIQHISSNILIQNDLACKAVLMQTIKLKRKARTRGPNASLSPHYLALPRRPQEVLLAIGGWSGSDLTNVIESYDNRAKRWVGVANFNETPRAYHGTVFLHGSVYLIGGYDGVHQLCTTHKYDLANYTWQEVAPMNIERTHVSVALLDGFIYAMGGFDGWQRLKIAEKYCPDANQWTLIAAMNEQKSHAGSTAYNGKIYICGGLSGASLSTAECYDPLTNQWTMIAAMSRRRRGVGVIAYFNEIYVLGGFNGVHHLNTVEAYNPNTNTWRPQPPMLMSHNDFGVGVVEDQLYAVGGLRDNTNFSCVERFDVKTGVWTKVHDMSVSRDGLSCSVVYDLPNMADYSEGSSCSPKEFLKRNPGLNQDKPSTKVRLNRDKHRTKPGLNQD